MSLPASLPEKFDASVPLSDPRYERFSQLRVGLGLSSYEAAREAGLPVTHRNAPRYDRHPEILARKAHLAKDDASIIAATRLEVLDQLLVSAKLDVLAEFGILGNVEVGGKKVPRVVGIDWKKLIASGKSAAITKFRFDPETGVLVDFDRDDRLQAIGQIRDMFGLRAPRRTELTGKGGGPVQSLDVTKLTHDQLVQLEGILAAAAPSGDAGAGEGGDRTADVAPGDASQERNQPSLDIPSNGR